MRGLEEDFSIASPVVNKEDNSQDPVAVVLMIEHWNILTKVAYTFNSQNMATAKQLYLALQKYKELLFAVGVKDHEENRMIQQAMREHMKELCGNKITIKILEGLYEYTFFKLNNNVEPKINV